MSLRPSRAARFPGLSGSLCALLLLLLLLTPPGPLASGESAQHAAGTRAEPRAQPPRRSRRGEGSRGEGGSLGKNSPPANLSYNGVSLCAAAGPVSTIVRELRCMCLTTTPGIHPRMITKMQVVAAGPQCSKVEVV